MKESSIRQPRTISKRFSRSHYSEDPNAGHKLNFIERESCPVCQSKNRKTLYSCGFVESPIREYLETFYAPQGGIELSCLNEGKYILVECSDCGLIYQRQVLNSFLAERLYEEWIDPQQALALYFQRQDLGYYWQYAQEILLAIAFLGKMPMRLKFLDFGMGWGYWCRTAQGLGCRIYGTEISAARISHSQSLGVTVISWDELHDHEFDFINTEQVFEHISHPLETLNHLSEALTPEGLIKISVPNGKDIKRRLDILDWTAPKGTRNSLNAVSPLEHINCFQNQTILRLASEAGLELVEFPANLHRAASLMGTALTMMKDTRKRESLAGFEIVRRMLRTFVTPSYLSTLRQHETYLFFRNTGSAT